MTVDLATHLTLQNYPTPTLLPIQLSRRCRIFIISLIKGAIVRKGFTVFILPPITAHPRQFSGKTCHKIFAYPHNKSRIIDFINHDKKDLRISYSCNKCELFSQSLSIDIAETSILRPENPMLNLETEDMAFT